MKTLSKLVLVSVLFQTIAASSVSALPLSGAARPMKSVERHFISEKQRTVAPVAHVMFCKRSPAECVKTGTETVVTMTRERRRQLAQINSGVNREIVGRNDAGSDTWSIAPAAGDCEDYAITKRHRLIRQGWPAAALRLAIARTRWGEGHLVLVVRTDGGDMVLDNQTNSVLNWRSAPLQWVMIQSSENPRSWYRL